MESIPLFVNDRSSSAKIGGMVILALCIYIGSYAALCEPSEPSGPPLSFTANNGPISLAPIPLVPTYKLGGVASAYIFSPLQKLDKRLFPKRWLLNWTPAPSLTTTAPPK